jgi:hypothetical protein
MTESRAQKRLDELRLKMERASIAWRNEDRKNDVFEQSEGCTGQYVATFVGDVWCSTKDLDNPQMFEQTVWLTKEEFAEYTLLRKELEGSEESDEEE